MAAIVRMRRRRDEDQMDEVVIHLKRARKSGNGEDEERLAKKFKYAATVDSKVRIDMLDYDEKYFLLILFIIKQTNFDVL